MNTLIFSILAFLVTNTKAAPGGYGGYGGGVVVSGPSGVVTDHGPVGPGPAGAGFGGFGYGGPGAGYGGPGGGYGGPGAGFGYGGFGGYGAYGGGHGITVNGPPTVPATIIGPSGKIVANGLYGVPGHGHGW